MNERRNLVGHLSTLVEWFERVVLTIGAALLLLWLSDPVRSWMERQRWMDLEGVVALCALAILFVLRAIERVNERIDRFTASEESSIIRDGTARVYEVVNAIIERHCEDPVPRFGRGRRTLDVLGITLFSAWNDLQPLLQKKTFCDWDVTFACMTPEFAQNEPAVPPDWAKEAVNRVRDITEFVRKSKTDLKKRNVTIRLYLYSHLPAIHGFRIEREEVLCSYIQWEGNMLAKPFQFYEHFAPGSRSRRAMQYRDLFANWLQRAHAEGPVGLS